MRKIKLTALFIAFISFGISTIADARMCSWTDSESGCTTTIIDYSSGWAWDITCESGYNASGNVTGGGYGGSCPVE